MKVIGKLLFFAAACLLASCMDDSAQRKTTSISLRLPVDEISSRAAVDDGSAYRAEISLVDDGVPQKLEAEGTISELGARTFTFEDVEFGSVIEVSCLIETNGVPIWSGSSGEVKVVQGGMTVRLSMRKPEISDYVEWNFQMPGILGKITGEEIQYTDLRLEPTKGKGADFSITSNKIWNSVNLFKVNKTDSTIENCSEASACMRLRIYRDGAKASFLFVSGGSTELEKRYLAICDASGNRLAGRDNVPTSETALVETEKNLSLGTYYIYANGVALIDLVVTYEGDKIASDERYWPDEPDPGRPASLSPVVEWDLDVSAKNAGVIVSDDSKAQKIYDRLRLEPTKGQGANLSITSDGLWVTATGNFKAMKRSFAKFEDLQTASTRMTLWTYGKADVILEVSATGSPGIDEYFAAICDSSGQVLASEKGFSSSETRTLLPNGLPAGKYYVYANGAVLKALCVEYLDVQAESEPAPPAPAFRSDSVVWKLVEAGEKAGITDDSSNPTICPNLDLEPTDGEGAYLKITSEGAWLANNCVKVYSGNSGAFDNFKRAAACLTLWTYAESDICIGFAGSGVRKSGSENLTYVVLCDSDGKVLGSKNDLDQSENEAIFARSCPAGKYLIYANKAAFFSLIVDYSMSGEFTQDTLRSLVPNYKSISRYSIPEGYTSIAAGEWSDDISRGIGVFDGCSNLKTVTLPDSLTSLGSYAFWDCSNLEGTIRIPKNVSHIGNTVFGDTNITAIDVDSDNPDFCSVDGVVFSKDKKTIVVYPASKVGSPYRIPDGVTDIRENTFRSCQGLESVVIPDSVLTIGKTAFRDCNNLVDVKIGNGVTSIGEKAFRTCLSLESIVIPDSVTSLGDNAFLGCSSLASVEMKSEDPPELGVNPLSRSLDIIVPNAAAKVKYLLTDGWKDYAGKITYDNDTGAFTSADLDTLLRLKNQARATVTSVEIPNGYTSIADSDSAINSVFYGCTSLESVTIPDSVTRIGAYVFQNRSLFTSITIPSGVTYIGNNAFAGCSGLSAVYVNAAIPPTLENGSNEFDTNGSFKIYVPSDKVSAYKEAWPSYDSKIEERQP